MIKKIALLLLLFSLLSCTKNDPGTPESTSLIIQLSHHVDGSPLVFNDQIYSNAFGNEYIVSRLQYFISDIKLVDNEGNVVHIDTSFYVDATNVQSMTISPSHKIPVGQYVEFQFVFGLNETMNTTGAFVNPPESNMEWPVPMGGGYHYMKLEGKVNEGGVQKNFQAHTGPTNGNQNYVQLKFTNQLLEASASENLTIQLGMNINKWWENPHLIDLNTISMVMGNQMIQEKLKANASDVFTTNP